jgi:hypothetical protein
MYRAIAFLFFGIYVILPGSVVFGQTTFATITGTVTDPSGAVLPGAKVTVTSEGEGTVRDVLTGSTGVFTVPNLTVGTYRLHVTATGFGPHDRTGIILSANQVLNADVKMTLAQAGVSVEVTAAGAAISTETTNLSNLKTSRDLQELPLVSRHTGDQGFYAFVLQNPGVNSMPGNSLNNVQGVRQQTGVIPTMDGIAVMAYPIGPGPVQPSLEGIQEVNVQLANTPAEFATPANFAVVTKSGTNGYHGSGFWDYNSSSLNARDFFSTAAPFRVYHNFGGSAGGPIRKDKTFFFGDYEGSREAANVVITGNTPLPPWRTGDFSGLPTPVIDPLTGAQFPGNRIPASRINAESQKTQDFFYPAPNFGPPGLQVGNWRGQFPGQTGFTHFDDYGVRVDQNFGNGDKVYGRVSVRRLPLTAREAVLPPIGKRDQIRSSSSVVASWTHLFSPSVVNEVRTGMTRQRNYYFPDLVGSDIIQQLGIQGVTTTGIHNVPAFNITGITTTDQPNPQALTLDTNFEWTDNVSWTRGRHSMKFGFDEIRDQLGGYNYPNSMYGTYNFNGTYTGFGYADFLLGIPQTTQLTIPNPPRYLRGTTWSLYAQDQFKVNQRLTLNYGLRYELLGPYYDRYGSIANFDPKTGAFILPKDGITHVNPFYPTNIPILSASQAGFPEGTLVGYPKLNFYPRVGAAYKPFGDDKTVIRAGFGTYGNLVYGSLGRGLGGGPFSGSTTYTNAVTNGVPLFSFPYPFLPTGAAATQNAFGVNPNLTTPYTEQWNFTVERQIGSAALRLSYVGSHSAKLIYARNLNQPPPSTIPFSTNRRPYPIFNSITYYENGGNQRYNGLQAAFAKNYGAQLTFNAGYTLAKDLTDTQEGTFAGQTIQNQFDRRSEYANNLITPTHRVYGYMIWQIPVGKGHRLLDRSGIVEAALGGWQMAWNAMAQSGQFFTPSFSGFDPSNTNSIGGRPDVVSGVSTKAVGTQSISNWFNPAAFKIPGCPDNNPVCAKPDNIGRFGNAGIAILRGPRIANADFTVSKYFPIYERVRLQFRMNAVNVFNHPNFSLPAVNISSPATVGRITSSTAATFGTVAPREIDFQLRLEF